VATVTLNPPNATLVPGQGTAFQATLRDASGNILSGRVVTWSVDPAGPASVNQSGQVTAIVPGATNVIATSEGRSGSAAMTVRDGGFVGPAGGQVTAAAGKVTLVVPPGALAAPVPLTVTAVQNPPAHPALIPGTAWDLGPDGIQFAQPVTLRIRYEPAQLPGGTIAGQLRVARHTGGAWVPVPGSTVDIATATVTAVITGFSLYGVIEVPASVASVTVSPADATLVVGGTRQLIATLRDAAGNILTGRTVTWAPADGPIARVSSTGLVTAVGPGGPVPVTATSEGQVGSALITVLAPVASVTVTGIFRVKVGDTYTYTATARLADGTVVVRPMTWGVLETGRALMSPTGVMTPLAKGTITILIIIDGVVWETTVTAYDWEVLSGGGSLFLTLDADTQIANKFGTSTWAELVLACSSTGSFLIWVDTRVFVTASGLVSFSFDGGPITSQTWIEFANFSALGHPGLTNQIRKNFALALAAARMFAFAFTEFQGTAKAMIFRVTGLPSLLSPLLNACPGAALRIGEPGDELRTALEASLREIRTPAERTPERDLRAMQGPQATAPPGMSLLRMQTDTREAVRRP
jgi:uncharacterized protein YjdB